MKPQDILQSHLDIVSRAVEEGDIQALVDNFTIPFRMMTGRADLVIATEEEFVEGCEAYIEMLRSKGMTGYRRSATAAVFLHADLISGTYETLALGSGTPVVPPFRSQILLQRTSGAWRGAAVTNSLSNPRWPLLLPDVAPVR